MKVRAIKCKDCGDIIYSRARHDFHSCSCKAIFIDGGFDYIRYGGKNLEDIEKIDLNVKATMKELYNDWNNGEDKFGIIRKKVNNDWNKGEDKFGLIKKM